MLAMSADRRSLSPNRISLDARNRFVDDRHRAQVEQAVERTAHVAVLLWGDRVGNGDEDLSDTQPVPCESGLVLGHQQALADGGARLLVGHVGRTLVETERAETGRNRAGGDQHHAAAHQSHAGDGRHKRVQPLRSKWPLGSVSELEPTFTTMVCASAMALRTCACDGVFIVPPGTVTGY